MKKYRHKLVISYDGTRYAGWQIQPNGLAVQEAIEQAINRVTGLAVRLHGSGRTDQGVHARAQVAHVDLDRPWPSPSLMRALNGVLPDDIRILRYDRVAPDFHARRSAIGKEYRYFIWNGDVLPAERRLYWTPVRTRLDVDAMNEAAAMLVGRHDFASFTANPNRVVESTVRRLDELRVRRHGHECTLVARGEGFLYKMVRSLAGFLIRVGEGAEKPVRARQILQARLRTAHVPTAPPQGLFLWRVFYTPHSCLSGI